MTIVTGFSTPGTVPTASFSLMPATGKAESHSHGWREAREASSRPRSLWQLQRQDRAQAVTFPSPAPPHLRPRLCVPASPGQVPPASPFHTATLRPREGKLGEPSPPRSWLAPGSLRFRGLCPAAAGGRQGLLLSVEYDEFLPHGLQALLQVSVLSKGQTGDRE